MVARFGDFVCRAHEHPVVAKDSSHLGVEHAFVVKSGEGECVSVPVRGSSHASQFFE